MSEPVIVPNHVGLILDGNRRWARTQGLSTLEGHRKGAEVLKEISLEAFRSGVKYLSAYTFSTENWKRTEEEVSYLMNLITKGVTDYADEIHKEGIKVVVLGRKDGVRKSVLKALRRIEEKTAKNQHGTMALCFNYGGQQEILDAVQDLVRDGTNAADITIQNIQDALYYPEVPPIDLIIRTSGEQRISNFMLWRAAYAELYFTDKYWPEFTIKDFDDALKDYATRQRRHGR